VPFTLAHAAAALPFRRTRLILSAVVVGTFAPDFEYFLRLVPGGHFGHTLPGVFVLDLPLSLVVLWLFHAYMREPMVTLLPDPIKRRIFPGPRTFRFWGPARLALIIGSILVGVGTHILWDSFTHPTFWFYRHWALLSQTVRLPVIGTVQYYKLFQHGSTVVGSAALLIWLLNWYRRTTPEQRLSVRPSSLAMKRGLLIFLTLITLSGALIRAFVGVGIPNSPRMAETFVGDAVVTAITLIWLQLLAYGIICSRQQKSCAQV
jgi:hypothetical protein